MQSFAPFATAARKALTTPGGRSTRRIERETVAALYYGESIAQGNSATAACQDIGRCYVLHGSQIAVAMPRRGTWKPHVSVTLAGQDTATTRSRLRAILAPFGASVWHDHGRPMLRVTLADGRRVTVEMEPAYWYTLVIEDDGTVSALVDDHATVGARAHRAAEDFGVC